MSTDIETGTSTDTNDAIMRLRDVSVSFDMSESEESRARVIDDVDLDIHRNEIIGIVGESGSGKSMLASALLDAVPKPGMTTGEITYYPEDERDEVSVLELEKKELKSVRWEDISMVFQGAMSSFNPTMTIRGHFLETIDAHNMDRDERMRHGEELLKDLHLNPTRVLDSYPNELSGGMRQRALVALSLLLDPDVLVMDEPTAALDLLMQRSIISMLSTLQEEYDLTIVFITHDLPLVAGLVDRLAVLYAFKIIEIGEKRDMLENATHPYTRALIGAVPKIATPVDEMRPIEGYGPDPMNVPSGCSYHPRCPLADEQCLNEEPPLETVEPDHETACYHWEDAEEAIPYVLDRSQSRDLEADLRPEGEMS
mgnify:FL=1|jgi:oligopeptide/dipeptide ABC transporter ATP-binding protein